MIVLNGDLLDGASISRHAPLGWEERPTVQDELNAVHQRLEEIEKASPSSKRYWVMGNHDSRFDMKLADALPHVQRACRGSLYASSSQLGYFQSAFGSRVRSGQS